MSEELFSGPIVNVYPLSNYSFGTKEPRIEKDTYVSDRLDRMKANYMREGMRTCVEGILLVQEYNHPHLLLLQVANAFFKLPGGRLKPGENEIEGLKRKLTSKLSPISSDFQPNWQLCNATKTRQTGVSMEEIWRYEFRTGECIGVWWRHNFESMMYPYCLPHISKPKECKKLFVVHLSEKEYFAIPKDLKLLAVPLFELFDNVQRYGPIISSIPQQLSRFSFNLIS